VPRHEAGGDLDLRGVRRVALARPDRNDSLSFRWKFGDGHETDFTPSPKATHVYLVPKPEGYGAQLIVWDGLWLHQCSLTVRVELLNLPPIAAIWCSAETMWLGDSLRCSANESQDEFQLTYLWDFDDRDGVSFSDDFRRDVSITYQEPAQYRITLQVKTTRARLRRRPPPCS